MAITAAQVEANGWVLRVTLTGSLGSFASYNLDPSGAPRAVLSSSHPGFVKSGGTAVAGSIARSTAATYPLRLPVNPASATVKVIDETDLGGGSIRVRLALSETIYATDTSLSLAVLAGWRTGEAAQSGISVTNSSTAVAPIPIFRWVLPPYDVTSGAFTASLFVVSHHPVGFQPVAGVKFTATDGTNTKTVWATALATDNTYGDNLRCYTVTLDPTTATALTAGLLRVDAEVYPFLGSMRSTDTAGTRSMTGMATAALSTAAAAPWVIGYDPAGTRYSSWFAYVDPVNGTLTASAAMITASHAAAKAIAPASRPVSVAVAVQAMYLVNRTLSAANGGSSATRAADGLKIRLAVGTHVGMAGGSVTTGLTVTEIPVLVEGDPDDSDPRTNCIWQTGTTATVRVPRMRLRRLNTQVGTVALTGVTTQWFLDDMTVSGKAGLETNTIYAFTATVTAGLANIFATKTKYWRTGSRLGSANGNVGLTRAVEHSRALNILAGVKNRFIPASEDATVVGVTGSYQTNGITGGTTDLGLAEDIVFAFCDARGCSGQSWSPLAAAAATAGTSFLSYRRHAIVNNIFERIGGYSGSMASYGEDQTVTVSYVVMEGNTVVGDRWNAYYSDPDVATLTDVNTKYNEAFCIRHANNLFDWNPTKQDDFNDPQSTALRGGTNGYRPQMIFAWGPHNGVGLEAHIDTRRAAGANPFSRDFDGVRATMPSTGTLAPGFTIDRSVLGTNAGLGDYTPTAGSPVLGRVTRGNSDRDFAGKTRLVGGAAGAIEPNIANLAPSGGLLGDVSAVAALGLALPLAVRSAVNALASGSPGVGWATTLGAAAGLLSSRVSTPVLTWEATVMPNSTLSSSRVSTPLLTWEAMVAPDSTMLSMTTHEPVIETLDTPVLLVPVDGRLFLTSATTLALPDGDASALLTLRVRADPRILFVN